MNPISLVEYELETDGIETSVNESKLFWNDSFGAECSIKIRDIAYNGKSLAFFQYNEIEGKNLIRIFNNHNGNYYLKNFNYRPNNGDDGISFWCNYIKWHDEHLICIYYNGGSNTVVSIKDTEVYKVSITERFSILENILYYKSDSNYKKIQLPSLIELGDTSEDDLNKILDSNS